MDETPEGLNRKDSKDWIARNIRNQLIYLWILADKLLIPRLQNMAIGKLYYILSEHSLISVQVTIHIWNSTRESSPLRCLCLDTWLKGDCSSFLKDHSENLPKEFLVELSCGLYKMFGKNPKSLKGIPESSYYVPEK